MAHILPETPPQMIPPEVLRVFRALKALPDTYYIWHHLAPWQPKAPDFLVINQKGQTFLIKISLSASVQAIPAAQILLIDDERPPLGKPEGELLREFIRGIHLPEDQTLETLVIFPNIPQRQVEDARLERKEGEPHWAGRECLQSESRDDWERFFPTSPLSPLWIEKLRQCFTPETVVPADLTVRPSNPRRLEAGLTDYLLDYNQEAAVKADLDLAVEGQNVSDDFRLNIINGVAGSGKTLILLYRLRLLYHLYPEKHFLVLTHNRPLIHDIEGRFHHLEGRSPETIEWRTFNGWCYRHWPKAPKWIEPLKIHQRQQLIQSAWRENLQPGPITERMFMSEVDWLKDQLPMSEAEYFTTDRRGRGFRLVAEQRQRVYQAIQAYRNKLDAQHALDWGDIPQRLWEFAQEGRIRLSQYDMILVDEAQFFAPLWIAILQRTLKQNNAHLFLVADPTQGFLGRGATWKSLGLQARGHSTQLHRSYRTTKEILQFATLFYRLRLGEENDEDILAPDLLNMPGGAFPQLISLTSAQDEIARAANEVEALVKQGLPRKQILLLHCNYRGVEQLKTAINHRLGKHAAIDPKETYPGDYIRVTTLNAGAGLESPIVFLVGLRELFEEEQSLRLSDDERETLIRDNTRKVYMAVTRAGQRLVFTYVGELPEILRSILGND